MPPSAGGSRDASDPRVPASLSTRPALGVSVPPSRPSSLSALLAAASANGSSSSDDDDVGNIAASAPSRKRAYRPETTAQSGPTTAMALPVPGKRRVSWQSAVDDAMFPDVRVQIPSAAAVAPSHSHHHHHQSNHHNHHQDGHDYGHVHGDSHAHDHHHHAEDAFGSKRPRRAPSSPTSVGDIDDPKAIPRCVHTTLSAPPAVLQEHAPPPAPMLLPLPPPATVRPPPVAPASANPAKLQSVIRGLQHVSVCATGCANPLCVSTRNFVTKVVAHMAAMRQRVGHDPATCGACQLWRNIVATHAPRCKTVACAVPLCAQRKQQK